MTPALLWLFGAAIIALGLTLTAWALLWDRPRARKRCPQCWYDMSAAEREEGGGYLCPECGRAVTTDDALVKTRRRPRSAALAALIVVIGAVTAAIPSYMNDTPYRLIPRPVLMRGFDLLSAERQAEAWDVLRVERAEMSPWQRRWFARRWALRLRRDLQTLEDCVDCAKVAQGLHGAHSTASAEGLLARSDSAAGHAATALLIDPQHQPVRLRVFDCITTGEPQAALLAVLAAIESDCEPEALQLLVDRCAERDDVGPFLSDLEQYRTSAQRIGVLLSRASPPGEGAPMRILAALIEHEPTRGATFKVLAGRPWLCQSLFERVAAGRAPFHETDLLHSLLRGAPPAPRFAAAMLLLHRNEGVEEAMDVIGEFPQHPTELRDFISDCCWSAHVGTCSIEFTRAYHALLVQAPADAAESIWASILERRLVLSDASDFVDELIEHLSPAHPPERRARAATLLGDAGLAAAAAEDGLELMLNSDHPAVRDAARRALIKIGGWAK